METSQNIEQIVLVEFKGSRRDNFYYKAQNEDALLERADQVIVQTDEQGEDSGIVKHLCPACRFKDCPEKIVLRKLTPADYAHLIDNQEKEDEAWGICQERIDAHDLEMKLTDIEYQFDRKKITFYYTADHRVDFRQLVRDLAAVYRTRIEMRQIGVRDEARRHGGVGVCGHQICCASFIEEFGPVNTQLAKDQGLPLNPSKLTGLCGKLKCCLKFEYGYYEEKVDQFPNVGEIYELPEGSAKVNHIDIFNDIIHFWVMDRSEMIEKQLDEFNEQLKQQLSEA